MMSAEQFKCLIPTPEAIKEGVLYCSTNATNSADIWSAGGTWFGAGVTIVMAVLAWRAWTTSKHQLKEMRESTKIDALVELRGIHSELNALITETADDVEALVGRLRAAEEKFKMVWSYPFGMRALDDFGYCMLAAAYAAVKDENKTTGKVVIYRQVISRGNLAFRRFYNCKDRRIEFLDQDLTMQVERLLGEFPGLFSDVEALYRPRASKSHE